MQPHPSSFYRPAKLLPPGLHVALAMVVGFTPFVRAQSTAPAAETSAAQDGTALLSAEALDDLLGPIALYPDALIALILPASTVPADITLAQRYLANGGDPNQVDGQSWDGSVKSLTRYPDVLKWLDDNLEWTTSVGDAFIAQPADVMNSVQRLREQAKAAGNLADTPQQKVVQEVVKEKTYIRIVPAEPEVIYVPEYDPQVVYVERQPDYIGPIIGFGVGFAVGSWLNYDCDWGRRGVYYGDYNPGWNRGGWNGDGGGGNNNFVNNNTNVVNNNITNITNNSAREWQPNANSRRQLTQHRQNYNRRVEAANAEVRSARAQNVNASRPGKAPQRLKSLPQPTRLATNKSGNHPNQKNPGNAAAVNHPGNKPGNNPGNGNTGKPGKAPGANAANNDRKPGDKAPGKPNNGPGNNGNAGKNNGNGKNGADRKPGPKAPSAPPSVAGELGKPNNKPNKPNNNANKPNNKKPASPGNGSNNGRNTARPKPSGNGGNNANRPNNPEASRPAKAPKPQQADRPKQNNAPSRPKASPSSNRAQEASKPRPQQSRPQQPKPQQQQQSRPQQPKPQQPKPQQAKPQQSRPQANSSGQANRPQSAPAKPKPSGNGGGGNNGSNNAKKKKSDKKDQN